MGKSITSVGVSSPFVKKNYVDQQTTGEPQTVPFTARRCGMPGKENGDTCPWTGRWSLAGKNGAVPTAGDAYIYG